MAENIRERFGEDLDNMLRELINKELENHPDSENEVEELNARMDGFMDTMSHIDGIFSTMETDMKKLEAECKSITKQLSENSKADEGDEEIITIDDTDTQTEGMSINQMFSTLQTDMKKLNADRDIIAKQLSENSKSGGRQVEVKINDIFAPSSSKENKEEGRGLNDAKPGADSLKIGLVVWARCKDQWAKATIIDIVSFKDRLKYKVKYKNQNTQSYLRSNHLACANTFFTMMPVGSRVAARYKDDGIFSGIVAESADENINRGRYLVFFDDGYAMYCAMKYVYLVYDYPADVWNDIQHKATSNYIKDYLSQTERPMLYVKEGQTLKVEFEGEWHRARCTKVDCSLVEVLYLSDNNRELIYRGSMRLAPLWRQSQQNQSPNIKKSTNSKRRMARAHTGMRKAHIEYTTIDLTGDESFSVKSPDSKSGSESSNRRRTNSWEAPWSRPLQDQKSNQSSTAATKLPQSYSELSGKVDIASDIFNRLEQKEKEKELVRSQQNISQRSSGNGNKKGLVEDFIDIRVPLLKTLSSRTPPFKPHDCKPKCYDTFRSQSLLKFKGTNLLLRPMLLGWTREVSRMNRGGYHVYYRTPCGRSCRNMPDVERYFQECKISQLDFDNFCFDYTVRPQNTSVIKSPDAKLFINDYSRGKENTAVSCVNEINMELPPTIPYSRDRVPGKGVKINKTTDFMVCCDCPDNCRDRSKCPCQQLTVQATSCSHNATVKENAGYEYKRLYTFLPTGVYECNPKCKCNQQCLNRVVQNGLKYRLQLFKTLKKGWGIRCLDDIANGSFVCVYTGKIETESNANTEGLMNGDEYLAELDHIEVAESHKQDYNENDSSGVESMSDDSDNETNSKPSSNIGRIIDTSESDDDDIHNQRRLEPGKKFGYSASPVELSDVVTVKKKRNMVMREDVSPVDVSPSSDTSCKVRTTNTVGSDTTDTDSETEFCPSLKKFGMDQTKNRDSDDSSDEDQQTNQTRKYFGGDGIYIIDAKQTGNLGRYLNHSCSPNLMVQNVFIDTHDLRFPWVAFFASCTIKAGTELTWDYNYEVGSVPGRVINCYCGSTKCRKRLL